MTINPLYQFLCDAPKCTAVEVGNTVTNTPAGWRSVSSVDHHAVEPAPRPRRGRPLSDWERTSGSFDIHLCPDHTDTFNEHLPRTDGHRRAPGRDATLRVSCSCEGVSRIVMDGHMVTGHGPTSISERTWWAHLPEALRGYATRTDA